MTSILQFKKDLYRNNRGGSSRFLKITCEGCGAFLGIYQKDGPGNLRRMYVDRLHVSKIKQSASTAACPACDRIIGTKLTYKKENRQAIRLYADSVVKQVISAKEATRLK